MNTEADPLNRPSPELAALQRAVTNCKGQAPLALAIGKKQGHVWHWLNRSGRVPAELVIDVERVSGVPRHELRPDIYPPPPPESPESPEPPPSAPAAARPPEPPPAAEAGVVPPVPFAVKAA